MKKINSIIEKAIAKSGNNEDKFYASIITQLFARTRIFDLLTDSAAIQRAAAGVIANNTASSSIFARDISKQFNEKIEELLDKAGNILGCSHDEHALFLAAVFGLSQSITTLDSQKIASEIIQKNIHRLTTIQSVEQYVGREDEQARIQRIIDRSERNDVIIIGEAGLGKTALARKVLHESNRLVYVPSLSATQMVQELLTINHNQETNPVVFLDEIASYDIQAMQQVMQVATVVATSNHTAYQRINQQHPELLTTFEVIYLEEQDKEEVSQIVSNKLTELSKEHGITSSKENVSTTLALTEQYIDTPAYPAKALMLLEEAVLFVKEHHEHELLPAHLKAIVAQKTNIPLGKLTDIERQDLSTLSSRLEKRVKGQSQAVDSVTKTLQRSRLGLGNKNKPIGSFLFVGPSGVGKTELAKALAEAMFGKDDNLVRIDMSEYTQDHSVQRLIGAPPGYVGFEAGGQLTNPVKKQPYSLVLLDEIEKAHPRIFDIFLQVLDDGRLTDGKGVTVDFRHSVVIATSNAGIEDIVDLYQSNMSEDEIEKEVKEILEDYFRIEFLNRFDHIVIFNALGEPALKEIAKKQLQSLASELQLRNIIMTYSDQLINKLVEQSTDPKYGARGLLRLVQNKVENVLAEKIVNGELKAGDTIAF